MPGWFGARLSLSNPDALPFRPGESIAMPVNLRRANIPDLGKRTRFLPVIEMADSHAGRPTTVFCWTLAKSVSPNCGRMNASF